MFWPEENQNQNQNQMSIPHLFRCPISLDIFTDPVTLSTGQTYDRSSIERWLGEGNLTCPVTMQKLQDPSMVPNNTLRHLINQWLLMVSQSKPDHVTPLDYTNITLATLKANLLSPDTTFSVRLETLGNILAVSEESDFKRNSLIQLEFYPLLLKLLFGSSCLEPNISTQNTVLVEAALQCVLNLSASTNLASLNVLKEASVLASFCALFEQGSAKIKTSLCCLIEAISSSLDTQELCFIFGRTRMILQGLISLLQQTSDSSASDAAIRALSGLCLLDSNRENVVREGGVHGLITYLSNSEGWYVSRALATLEILLGLDSGKEALMNSPNAVKVLVKMVFRVSDHEGSESAVSALLIICWDSLSLKKEVISAGGVRQLLLLLQSQCSERAKAKARILLKLLRSMWVEDARVLI